MLYLYVALSLLMSTATIVQGASNSDAEADAAMLARMTAKASQSLYQATSPDDQVQQLIAQNSQRQYEEFSPERAVEAQKKFNAKPLTNSKYYAPLYVPIASTCSELQRCFKSTYVSAPTNKELFYKTIRMLTPHADDNKLETVMIASSNKRLLADVTLTTALWALDILAGNSDKEPLMHLLFAATKLICTSLPSCDVSNIQGSSFEFTRSTAPVESVMMTQSLLPRYFEYEHDGNIAKYVDALEIYGENFIQKRSGAITPVLIPDVPRLQAYLAQKDIPAAVIVDYKELTDPKTVLSATMPEFTTAPGGIVISQKLKLERYLAALPDIAFTEE